MAELVGAVGTSHIPAVGVAIDKGKTQDPYWSPYFAKLPPLREWIADVSPDVCIVVYNDHANAFSLDMIPTFAIGCGEEYKPADEGWGPRAVPPVQGHGELAAHIAHSVIQQDFDLTLINRMTVDHGLTVPLSLMFGQVSSWPVKVIPICVNVTQYPPPRGERCWRLGESIARAVSCYEEDLNVQIWGTGGMSHQLQGARAGLINQEFDQRFLENLTADPQVLRRLSHVEYVRESGSEGIELIMWLIMRGALGRQVQELHRFYHVPASNTAVGHIVLKPEGFAL